MHEKSLLLSLAAAFALAIAANAAQPAEFVGIWSFDGTCNTADALQLREDGSASLQDGFVGTWESTRDGRIVLDVQPLGDENDPSLGSWERFEYRAVRRVGQSLQIVVEGKRRITLTSCGQQIYAGSR